MYSLILELKYKECETYSQAQKDLEKGHSMNRGYQVERPWRKTKFDMFNDKKEEKFKWTKI